MRKAPSSPCAVDLSQMTAAAWSSPRRQLGLAASRSSRESGWKPAAINMVRAFFRKGGQREAIAINGLEGTGMYGARESAGERN